MKFLCMQHLTRLIFLFLILSTFKSQAQTGALAAPSSPGRYIGMAELGYLYGKSNNTNASFNAYRATPTVQMFNGYRLSRFLALGATFGFDFYDNVLITPVAFGIRGEICKARVSPFYSLDMGYGSASLSNKSDQYSSKGGWLFNPALGLRVHAGDRTAFTFGLGYKTQRVKTNLSWWGGMTAQKINYKRLAVRMGFIF